MDIWKALRSSPTANQMLGELIRRHDENFYQRTLDQSLSDREGLDIDRLSHFPTPDAIRNLVLLAVADYQNYRSIHAYWALAKLSQKKNWSVILDQAEQTYPELRKIRPDLESWTWVMQGSHPTFSVAAKDFSRAIVESNPSDPRLLNLAVESLPNRSLLDHLEKKGLISPDQTTILNETEVFIKEVADEFDQQRQQLTSPLSHIDRSAFQERLRKTLLELLHPTTKDQQQSQATSIDRLVNLAQTLLKQRTREKTDFSAISYLCSEDVVKKFLEPPITDENKESFLTAYVDCPDLTHDYALREAFCKQFKGRETVIFFRDMDIAYRQNDEVGKENFTDIIKLVGADTISRERALELSTSGHGILGHHLFQLARDHPTVFLTTDQGCDFFRKVVRVYNETQLHDVIAPIEQNRLSREIALEFPKQAGGLMDEKMRGVRSFIFANAQTLIKDVSDLRFLNRLVGGFGQKADTIIRGYHECLTASAISREDKELVLEFTKQFRVLAPTTIKGYVDAKTAGHEKVYVAQLQAVAERMTGSGTISDEERGKPYYKDLLHHVYANNSGQWTTCEKNESCDDRSGDLADFKIRKRYEIDLLSQSEIRIKSGEQADPAVIEGVKKPILAVAERMNALGHDKEKIMADLQMEIDSALKNISGNEHFQEVDLTAVTSLDEKLFLLLADSLYGSQSLDQNHLKRLMITYEFAMFEDINNYIAGTTDRVARASNQDYALLCEVGAFYSDRIKEVNRRLVEAAWKNPTIAALMPGYFQKFTQEGSASQRQAKINRLNIEKLGASDNFIKQLTKILEKRKGKQYRPEEVRKILRRYEDLAKGFQEKTSASPNPQTRAFYGQLRSQRERTFEAFEAITGETIDPASVHLGEINLQQAQSMEADAEHGKYDEEQFAAYTVQRSIDLFESEKLNIEGELAKFESLSGQQREVLHGFISKNRESANARMVGGVCVSGDNPAKSKEKNLWDMPNYFQLVFQEPDTLQCQGLVLLHHFNENGEKILAASMNPSSTYLYSVDEAALFNGMMNVLVDFAAENHFDKIVLSKNKAIRTNRTGGTFERTMDARITNTRKDLTFNPPQRFSFSPTYLLNEMDVIWERPTSSSPA